MPASFAARLNTHELLPAYLHRCLVAATPAPELSRPLALVGLLLHFLQMLGFPLQTLLFHSRGLDDGIAPLADVTSTLSLFSLPTSAHFIASVCSLVWIVLALLLAVRVGMTQL